VPWKWVADWRMAFLLERFLKHGLLIGEALKEEDLMRQESVLRTRKSSYLVVVCALAAFFLVFSANQVTAQTLIDHFNNDQDEIRTNALTSVQSSQTGSMIGGYRWLTLTKTAGSNYVSASVNTHRLNFSADSGATGNLLVTWNGSNTYSSESLAEDLSDAGDTFVVDVISCDWGVDDAQIRAYTSDTAWSAATFDIPAGIAASTLIQVSKGLFLQGGASAVSWNKVNRIELYLPGISDLDLRIEQFYLDCLTPAPTVATFTANPNWQTSPQLTTLCWTGFNAQGNPTPVTFRIDGLSGGAAGYSWVGTNTSACPTTTPLSIPASYRLKVVGLCDNSTYTANIQGEPSRVPSLNEWGMIILSLILAASAVWFLRRRKTN